MPTYDTIVLGLGVIGSGALCELARRGQRVLGIDSFGVAHDRGSSHGSTRIIRRSYFEHPEYVPLLNEAFDAWKRIERDSGVRLYHRTGLLLIGEPDGMVLSGVRRSANEHAFDLETLNATEVRKRFPAMRVSDHMEALFEPDGGFLSAEESARAQIDLAKRNGAEVLTDKPVVQWQAEERRVVVHTADRTFEAGHLVICAGPWTSTMLPTLGVTLTVLRKSIFWFDAPAEHFGIGSGFPPFCVDSPDGFFYGFPIIDEAGMKVAEHSGGKELIDPTVVDRSLNPDDLSRVQSFLAAYLPSVTPQPNSHSTCMYTMSPDEQFIIDRHPTLHRVVFATGFSGHGFKFAPVVGSMLARLVTGEDTEQPLAFLSLRRFA